MEPVPDVALALKMAVYRPQLKQELYFSGATACRFDKPKSHADWMKRGGRSQCSSIEVEVSDATYEVALNVASTQSNQSCNSRKLAVPLSFWTHWTAVAHKHEKQSGSSSGCRPDERNLPPNPKGMRWVAKYDAAEEMRDARLVW